MRRAAAARAAFVDVDVRRTPGWRAGDAAKPFGVECLKSTGRWILFSRYATRPECEMVADRLAALGCPTRIIE